MLRVIAIVLMLLVLPVSAQANAQESAPTILHLLDYISVDYAEAVAGGKIKNADEFKEMNEFAGQVASLIGQLPDNPARARLVLDARKIIKDIAAMVEPAQVSRAATELRWALIRAYRITVAPKRSPDLARGAALYQENCAGCHGATGRGDGIAGKGMEPAPSDFHDAPRMAQRSAYGLYNTVTLGVAGTGMAAFRQLSEDDRWALAFHAAGFATAAARAQGESLWKAGRRSADLAALDKVATLSANEVRAKYGEEGLALQAYLLANPGALAAIKPPPIEFTLTMLATSLETYRAGNRTLAMQQAITAYLEGYELAEASLANVDAPLSLSIEREMTTYRSLVQDGAAITLVEGQVAKLQALLERARERLAGDGLSGSAAFLASLFILLREGVEAILVVAAILAFLGKAGRNETKRYVHLGWLAALALGGATWFAATYLIDISGANREITEGVTALISAAMLIYVGFWLHSKSHSAAWQQFIKATVGGALSAGTVWTLGMVSFLAVYREAFETVLFYQALFAQSGPQGSGPILSGLAVAGALLLVIGWVILRVSVRLPIGIFFAASGALLALLAVVFTGQGIAALQEAGKIGVDALGSLSVPMLGIFPTMQTLGAQAAVLSIVVAGFYWMRCAPSVRVRQ